MWHSIYYKNCAVCKHKFSSIRINSLYCSPECGANAKRLRYLLANPQKGNGAGTWQVRGKNHHNYKNGIKSYAKTKKNNCERCRSRRFLLVHHKNEDRTDNSKLNLETLCKSCHQLHHAQQRKSRTCSRNQQS